MIYQMPNKKVIVPTLTTDYVNIERVQHLNFLGLILDTHFNWHTHIEKIANNRNYKQVEACLTKKYPNYTI